MSTAYEVEKLRAEVDQVLAAHGETRDIASFAKYRGRPVDFMREELGFTPYEMQIEVIEAFERDRRIVVAGCHGAGKDAILAPLMLYAAYVLHMLVLAISATERQLLGQLWREVARRFSSKLPGTLLSSDLRIGGEKRMIAMTSNSVDNLTGWHDPNGVFIAISESQAEQVENAAFDAAIANAVDDASRIVVVGNPIKAEGRFYEASQKGTWHFIQISAFDHPNVRDGFVVIPGGPAPGWPAEMAREFGEESPWYISRVLGQFPPVGSVDSLVRVEWLEAAYARHVAAPGFSRFPVPVVALDVARSVDRDESVAAVVQGPRVHSLHAWRVRDLVLTAERFLHVTDRARLEWFASTRRTRADMSGATVQDPTKLAMWLGGMGIEDLKRIVDTPGVGSGVVDDLKRRGRPATEYWGWSPPEKPEDQKRYANKRALVYWNIRTLLENGTAVLPFDPLLHGELLAMMWSQDSKGRIEMMSKELLKKALGRSPDRSDASAIGLAERLVHNPTVSISQWESSGIGQWEMG